MVWRPRLAVELPDAVALAKLVMKEGEKPGKFLLPHGIILLIGWLCIFMEDNP